MAQLGDYVAAERADTVYLGLYTSCRIETGAWAASVETAYPWDGDVRLTVECAPDRPYAVKLRIPGWARDVTLDGEPVAADDGWLTVERLWAAGDTVRLHLPMPVRGHLSHPHLDATRGAVGVARGPLVYCVEQQDSPVSVDDLGRVLSCDQGCDPRCRIQRRPAHNSSPAW